MGSDPIDSLNIIRRSVALYIAAFFTLLHQENHFHEGSWMEMTDKSVVKRMSNGLDPGGKNEPAPKQLVLTDSVLKEKIDTVLCYIGGVSRRWFPVCKFLMEKKVVGDGDFKSAVRVLSRLYPDKTFDAHDLSSMNVQSFARPLSEWTNENAPVGGATLGRYLLIADVLNGIIGVGDAYVMG